MTQLTRGIILKTRPAPLISVTCNTCLLRVLIKCVTSAGSCDWSCSLSEFPGWERERPFYPIRRSIAHSPSIPALYSHERKSNVLFFSFFRKAGKMVLPQKKFVALWVIYKLPQKSCIFSWLQFLRIIPERFVFGEDLGESFSASITV